MIDFLLRERTFLFGILWYGYKYDNAPYDNILHPILLRIFQIERTVMNDLGSEAGMAELNKSKL